MTIPAASESAVANQPCRFCGAALERTFVDLGMSPLCETYPAAEELNRGETFYPLHVYVCGKCFLVQLEQYESRKRSFPTMRIFLRTRIRG